MKGFFYASIGALIFYLATIAAVTSSFWLQWLPT